MNPPRLDLTFPEIHTIINCLGEKQRRMEVSIEKFPSLPETIEFKKKEIASYQNLIEKLSRFSAKCTTFMLKREMASQWREDCYGKIVDPDIYDDTTIKS